MIFFRWIKYEQSVEGDGTRFSKPHITLLSVLGLIQLKNCLRKGIILLDVKAQSCAEIGGTRFYSVRCKMYSLVSHVSSKRFSVFEGRIGSGYENSLGPLVMGKPVWGLLHLPISPPEFGTKELKSPKRQF